MRSFAAVVTLAAPAFSVVTSALPSSTPYATAPYPSSAHELDVSSIVIEAVVQNINVIVEDAANIKINLGGSLNVPDVASDPTTGHKGVLDVLIEVTTKVAVLVQAAQITPDIDAHAALDLALQVFAQIQGILKDAVVDIQAIVDGDISVSLYLGGKAQDVKVIAEVLATLLEMVVLALGLAVEVCISADISALLAVVVDIAGVLSVIIGLVVKVAADVVVELQTSIQVIVHIVVGLKLQILAKALCIAL
ncbi:hypothetical protein Ac2012v2_007316 [Leucoagaricus gongylophorus]